MSLRPPRGLGKTHASLAGRLKCFHISPRLRRSHVRCGSRAGCSTWSREVVHSINCSGRRNRRPGQPCRPRTSPDSSSSLGAGHRAGLIERGALDCQDRRVADDQCPKASVVHLLRRRPYLVAWPVPFRVLVLRSLLRWTCSVWSDLQMAAPFGAAFHIPRTSTCRFPVRFFRCEPSASTLPPLSGRSRSTDSYPPPQRVRHVLLPDTIRFCSGLSSVCAATAFECDCGSLFPSW